MENLKIGDTVIVKERGPDYGKMCKIIEASDTNEELPVRIQLINQHDSFRIKDTHFCCGTEKWIERENLKLYVEREYG